MAAAIAKRRASFTSTVTPTTACEESMRVVSISEIAGDEPLTISPATLRFSAARMELAFREQLSDIILDGIPSEVCWLVLGSALGYANFVLAAFGSGQTLAAIIPLAALGLAAVLATPALCLQGLFDWAPSRVLSLLASCASVLLLACPLATSVLCTTTPCSDGDGWRLAASAQDALLVVSVLSTLFAGLPMLHGCLPVLVAAAAQAVVLAVRRDTLFAEHDMATECLRRGSCLLLLLLLVVSGARRREALDRAAFLTAEGGVELQMALLQQPGEAKSRKVRRSKSKRNLSLDGCLPRSVHLSSPMEQAIHQMRTLLQRVSAIEGSEGGHLATGLARALDLLEQSAARSTEGGYSQAEVDWTREIEELGVDDTIGSWLQSTLSKGHALSSHLAGRDSLRKSMSRLGSMSLSPNSGRLSSGSKPKSPPGQRRKRVASESLSTGSSLVPAGGQHDVATAAALAGCPESGQQPELDENTWCPYEPSAVEAATMALVHGALDTWSNDCICLEAQSSANCLVLVAEAILDRHGLVEACHLDRGTLRAFLLEIQSRYGSGQYHNSVHGADVMLSTHLFLTKFGVVGRLTKLQLLAALLGAVVHDFNHPGTSNAHEIKVHSRLAILYSDQSVLEQHHLASAFAVLHTPGTELLSGLTAEEFVMVRSLMIEMVQHTDLSKHFDFITRLKTLAASKGHAAHVKQYQGLGGSFGKHAEGGVHEGAVSRDGPRKPGRRGSGSGSERRRTLFMAASSKPGEPPAQQARRGSKEGTPRRRPSATTEQANRGSFDPTKRRKSLVTSLVLSLNGTDQLEEPPPPPPPPWKTPYLSEDVDVRLVVATALKFADLGHSFKPFHLHEQWTAKITEEFWLLGDREKSIGVPTSPLCDRERDLNIAQSQMGFFQFICSPFLKVVADLLEPEMEPHAQLQANFKQWQLRREAESFAVKQAKESLRRSGDEAASSSSSSEPPHEPRLSIADDREHRLSYALKSPEAPCQPQHAPSPVCDPSPRATGSTPRMATERQPGPECVVSLE